VRLFSMVGWKQHICQPLSTVLLALGLVFALSFAPAMSDPLGEVRGAEMQVSTPDAFASNWVAQGDGSARMRLITQGLVKDSYTAAVQIQLAPTAITYWRQPGEAGVPPEFSFTGSENLANATVLYPAPSRMDEAGLQAFGYRGGVTFPIKVHPIDPQKPVHLKLTLAYAICDKICLPAKGQAELVLPQSGAGPEQGAIAAAEANVPLMLKAEDVAKDVTIRAASGGAKPQWLIQWQGATAAADLFAEGPQGWDFDVHKTGTNSFSLTAVDRPEHAPPNVAVRLTVTSPDKSYEFTAPLDAGVAAR
jgi:DsbC/DsbD-like thiol-disulfide interchange protein